MNPFLFVSFALYFSILFTICYFAHKLTKTEADFVIGSRSLNFWLTAFSAHAADMSAWLFMALPAAIFIGGLSNVWVGVGLWIGMSLNWQFIAPKLRKATEQYKSLTLSTFFSHRFGDKAGVIRRLTAAISIVFLTWYLCAGLIAMGYLFESLFGINYHVGISMATVAVVIYTFAGGFITVAWTDLFQALFLLTVILFLPLYAFGYMGGYSEIIQVATERGISLQFIDDPTFSTYLSIFCLSLGWGLGYFGQPHIVTKFMGIKSAKDLAKAKYVGMSWQFLALLGSVCVGLIGIAFFKEGLANPELVFVEMVKGLFHPLIAGFVLCAVLAANISTMDSQVLVAASVITEDLYKGFFKKQPTSKQLLKISRMSVVAVATISLAMAWTKSATVMETVFYAWTGLGASFGPMIIMALYFPKTNFWGALTGIVVGGSIAAFWDQFGVTVASVPIPAMIPGFFLSVLGIFVVSTLTYEKAK